MIAAERQTDDDLVILVGYGKVTAAEVAEVLVPDDRRKQGPTPEVAASANPSHSAASAQVSVMTTSFLVRGYRRAAGATAAPSARCT